MTAFEEFFKDYFPILAVFGSKYIDNPETNKDIAIETLYKYWERREDFSEIYQVKSFLYQTVKNRYIDIIRHSKTHNKFVENYKNITEKSYSLDIIEQETTLLVRKAVDGLPESMREIINLSMKGYTNAQIAEKLNISPGTVHSSKKVAYQKLRASLGKYFVFFFV